MRVPAPSPVCGHVLPQRADARVHSATGGNRVPRAHKQSIQPRCLVTGGHAPRRPVPSPATPTPPWRGTVAARGQAPPAPATRAHNSPGCTTVKETVRAPAPPQRAEHGTVTTRPAALAASTVAHGVHGPRPSWLLCPPLGRVVACGPLLHRCPRGHQQRWPA